MRIWLDSGCSSQFGFVIRFEQVVGCGSSCSWVQCPFMFGVLFRVGLNLVAGLSTNSSTCCFGNLFGVISLSHILVYAEKVSGIGPNNSAGRASRYPRLRTWVSRPVLGCPGVQHAGVSFFFQGLCLIMLKWLRLFRVCGA